MQKLKLFQLDQTQYVNVDTYLLTYYLPTNQEGPRHHYDLAYHYISLIRIISTAWTHTLIPVILIVISTQNTGVNHSAGIVLGK